VKRNTPTLTNNNILKCIVTLFYLMKLKEIDIEKQKTEKKE
jgi:hypothetical protein